MRGESAVAEASKTLQQPEARHVFSWGSCPWVMGLWQWRAAQPPRRGGVDSDLCLHTGFLVAESAALAFHVCLWCPHCLPRLTPISEACLGGALNPLSSCILKQWSLAS